MVGDFINLHIDLAHDMHVLDAKVIFESVNGGEILLTLEGILVAEETRSWRLSSRLLVSQEVEVEDVPGIYRLSYVEIGTASLRPLRKDASEVGGAIKEIEIVPEPDEFSATMNIDHYTLGPVQPTDEANPS